MKNLSHDSWSSGRDSNPGPPDYEAGLLTSRLRLTNHNKYLYIRIYVNRAAQSV
jgi:hypothetical protein